MPEIGTGDFQEPRSRLPWLSVAPRIDRRGKQM